MNKRKDKLELTRVKKKYISLRLQWILKCMYMLLPQKLSLINQWPLNIPLALPQKVVDTLRWTTGVKYFYSDNLIVCGFLFFRLLNSFLYKKNLCSQSRWFTVAKSRKWKTACILSRCFHGWQDNAKSLIRTNSLYKIFKLAQWFILLRSIVSLNWKTNVVTCLCNSFTQRY